MEKHSSPAAGGERGRHTHSLLRVSLDDEDDLDHPVQPVLVLALLRGVHLLQDVDVGKVSCKTWETFCSL